MNNLKYLYLLPFFPGISMFCSAQSQIPNGGFEIWEVTDTIPPINPADPVGWTTSNFLMNAGGNQTVFMTDDAVEGNYAVRLVTDTSVVLPPFGNGMLDTLSGFVALGVVNQINPGGIAYSERPDSMSVWVKGIVVPGDTSSILATLTRFNPTTQANDTIATSGRIGITSTDTVYKKITVPFNYISSENPDLILFQVGVGGRRESEISPGNELFVDDIQLIGLTTSIQQVNTLNKTLKIMPNPFSDQTRFEFENPNNDRLDFTLINSSGQIVHQAQGIHGIQYTMQRNNLPPGQYFFLFKNNNGTVYNGKLIIINP